MLGADGNIMNDETFPTQHTGNNGGKLLSKCYKLLQKHSSSGSEYCYHFYIENNKQEKDVRKM